MFGRYWLALFMSVFLATGIIRWTACAADDPAAALLAKHAAYAGWRGGDGSIKTLRETGDVRRDGKVVRQLRRLQMGAIYRSSAAESDGTFETGFTGRVFWQCNVNGFTVPDSGDVVKYLATRAQLADEELTALAGTIRGTETIDGVATTTVRVVAQAGLPVDLSIDPQTGAFKRIAIDPDGRYEERFDVLADADAGRGKRVMSSWRYVGSRAIYTYSKIEANTTMTADELHPPKPVATWTFGPPGETTPITLTDKRIFIDATVNGHPGHFVLDTGAAGIALTDSFARLAGAKRIGQGEIVGIGGGARSNLYRVDSLAIGSNTLHEVRVMTGLDERSDFDRRDGFIGFDLLAGAIVEADLDARVLRIHDPAVVAPDTAGGFALHVDLSTGQPRVPMTVAARAPVLATLDTGNTFYALFSSQLVTREHVRFFSPSSLAKRMEFYGVNGHETDTCGRLESLELGPIAYRPVPACMSDSMSDTDVLVGFDFLKHFNYVFDYPDGEIVLTARKIP
jgi:predicted aspartyl protease